MLKVFTVTSRQCPLRLYQNLSQMHVLSQDPLGGNALFLSLLFVGVTHALCMWGWCVVQALPQDCIAALQAWIWGGDHVLAFSSVRGMVTWYSVNLGWSSLALYGLIYCCFIILCFFTHAIVCWWKWFRAGRQFRKWFLGFRQMEYPLFFVSAKW